MTAIRIQTIYTNELRQTRDRRRWLENAAALAREQGDIRRASRLEMAAAFVGQAVQELESL